MFNLFSIKSKYIFELGLFIFFLELNCNNKTTRVTENNCKIIPKIINVKLDAQPGIALSVNNFWYKIYKTEIVQMPIPYNEYLKIRIDKKSKYTEIELNP